MLRLGAEGADSPYYFLIPPIASRGLLAENSLNHTPSDAIALHSS
ncbi:hypothetical protein [Coleofasciculus sp. E2-BRE-01]